MNDRKKPTIIDPQVDRLLGIRDVQAQVNIGRSLIYKLLSRNEFPPGAKIGKRILWRQSDITAFIKSHFGPTAA